MNTLKRLASVSALIVLGLTAGCAPAEDDASDSTEQHLSGERATQIDMLDACRHAPGGDDGFSACTDAFVLKAIFTSSLNVKTVDAVNGQASSEPASQFIASWLQPQPEIEGKSASGVHLEVSAPASGKRLVTVKVYWLGVSLAPGGATLESSCQFKFTLDRASIVERSVGLQCAG